jgi:hypothetical protein
VRTWSRKQGKPLPIVFMPFLRFPDISFSVTFSML